MCKEFKDGLKGNITINGKEFSSIYKALLYDYQYYKAYGEGNGVATYRGKLVDLNLSKDGTYESLYSNVEKQVKVINIELDGE